MPKGVAFWMIMIIVLLFGGWGWYVGTWGWQVMGISFVVWVLIALVGWQVFGPPIQ